MTAARTATPAGQTGQAGSKTAAGATTGGGKTTTGGGKTTTGGGKTTASAGGRGAGEPDAKAAGLLDAGAVLPGPAVEAGDDTVTARVYAHPALTGRTVVRLTGAAVGPAEDLALEFLGLAATTTPIAVGHARRQALGFPGWALVHDPANGRHALALVKEMQRLARVAKSKPGNAKQAYDRHADRLGRAAPHFLPTYWEEVGRAFLAAENKRLAGTCFTEARRAEQVHGLAVDEARVRDVYLEYAYAGALTAKTITDYAKSAADRHPPGEAYELVRTLAVRRVAGGLAPHATMVADLRRMAKAAGLDADDEARELARELIALPATARATESVWASLRDPLVAASRDDAALRRRLLDIRPNPPGWRTDSTDWWIALLDAAKSTDELVAGDAGPAGPWLDRLLSTRPRGAKRCERLERLVERLVPRLLADGYAIGSGKTGPADLDVLDILVAGGVPVASGSLQFDAQSWLVDTEPGRRDLSALAAHPVLGDRLADAVGVVIRQRRFVEAGAAVLDNAVIASWTGLPGIAVAARRFVTRTVATAGHTVRTLSDAMSALATLWSPAGMALAPEAFGALGEIDVAEVLARTLRTGLAEELTWPAYESAVADLKAYRVGNTWPDLVVYDDHAAHIITPDGTDTEHRFRIPARPANSGVACVKVGDQLLVAFGWNGSDGSYWSGDPTVAAGAALPHIYNRGGRELLGLPIAGGHTLGGDPWYPGDPPGGGAYAVASDGSTFWRCVSGFRDRTFRWLWQEFDPVTKVAGRESLPAFFAAPPAAGPPPEAAVLEVTACELRPAPAAFATSPLGWRDGLVGFRVWRLPDGSQVGEGIDGRRVAVPAGAGMLLGAVLLPGDELPRPVTAAGSANAFTIWLPGGEAPAVDAQTDGDIPPTAWWHACVTRDEACSHALRAADAAATRTLLEVPDSVVARDDLWKAAQERVSAWLPDAPSALQRSIASLVFHIVPTHRQLAVVPTLLATPIEATAPTSEVPFDQLLDDGWNGLIIHRPYRSYSPDTRRTLVPMVRSLGKALGGADTPLGEGPTAWLPALTALGAIAMRAASPTTDPDQRAALGAFLATVAETPLADDRLALRVLSVVDERDEQPEQSWQLLADGQRRTVLTTGPREWNAPVHRHNRQAVQVSPDGKFLLPRGVTIRDEGARGRWRGSQRLRKFVRLLAERGAPPWRPEAAARLAAATGMTGGEAAYLLGGLPEVQAYQASLPTPQQRAALGLSAPQAKAAKATFAALQPPARLALLEAAMPDDPAALWEHGPDVDAVAATWISLFGVRTVIAEWLLTEATSQLPTMRFTGWGRGGGSEAVRELCAPGPEGVLRTDGKTGPNNWGGLQTTADRGTPFTGHVLVGAAGALAWLAYKVPWGDPLRATLPVALDLIRARLANPDLLLDAMPGQAGLPAPSAAITFGAAGPEMVPYYLVPARLSGLDDPALGFAGEETAGALRLVLGDEADAMVATPDAITGPPQDPRVSVPDLVAEFARVTGLGDDAAAYHLQILALPDPTDRNVQAWNGWKPAALRAAQAALVDAGLVVAARRERAGRPVFLAGGWLALRAPGVPLESWKQSLYTPLRGMMLVRGDVPALFRRAWSRYAAGDPPRYVDLKETR